MKFVVKDFMSKEIKAVRPDMRADEALKLLIRTGASGLPVIDEDDKLLGVFTEKEILKAVLPVYVKDVGDFVYSETSKIELKKMANFDKLLVKDLMRKEVPTIGEGDSLTEASRIMLIKSERRIVVVRDNKVVGIITRYDVVKALAEMAGMMPETAT